MAGRVVLIKAEATLTNLMSISTQPQRLNQETTRIL